MGPVSWIPWLTDYLILATIHSSDIFILGPNQTFHTIMMFKPWNNPPRCKFPTLCRGWWNLEFDLPGQPVHYQHDPVQTIKTSVVGAMNMLGLAKRTGAKIFQASTSEVYGDPGVSPQSEDYWGNVNPIGLRSCYDEGKRAAESLFFDYYRQHKIDIRVVRIFNTYGPIMHPNDGRVVSNFIVQA